MAADDAGDIEAIDVNDTPVDLHVTDRFLKRLDPAGEFTFQTFGDDKSRKAPALARILHGKLFTHAHALVKLNAQGAGVFVTINQTDALGRTAKNIIRPRSVFVDLDGAPLEPVLACKLKPHIVIESSPGRGHAYWLVDGLALESFGSVQQAIARRFGGDPVVCDLPRVMRLPGFCHQKVQKGGNTQGAFQSRIVELSDAEPYTADQILAEFPSVVEDKPHRTSRRAPECDPVLGTLNERGVEARPGRNAGLWHFDCPWADEHTDGDRDSAYYEAHTNGYAGAGWRCLHAHCADRTIRDLRDYLELDCRPVIDTQRGNLPGMVQSAICALKDSNVPIYDRGGQLVRTVRAADAPAVTGVKRNTGGIVLRTVEPEWVRLRLAEVANWQRYDLKQKRAIAADPPPDLCRALALTPDEGDWPPLRSVVRHPVLTPAGRYIGTDGYDAQTGLLLDLLEPAEPLPDGLDLAATRAAVERLGHLLRHYPWVGKADRSVALSLLLTALARPVLSAAPLHAIDAPAAGSGKSLLVDVASILATGERAAVLDYGRDPIEAAKRLDGLLLAGDPVIALDNIEAPLDGAALCQTLTQLSRRIRPLGSSAMVSVPCTSLVAATGNNLIIRGDMVRRAITCRLDAGTDNPELRDIQQDLIAEVSEQRSELVRDCLIIMAAYIHAGNPDVGVTPLGSFEEWSRMVRSALVWVGCADPCEVMERTRADDPERQAVHTVLSAWRETFGDEVRTAEEVVGDILGRDDLRDALTVVAQVRGQLDVLRLRYWLRSHRDARAGPLQLVNTTPGGRAAKWCVKDTSAPPGSFQWGDPRSGNERYMHAYMSRPDTRPNKDRLV